MIRRRPKRSAAAQGGLFQAGIIDISAIVTAIERDPIRYVERRPARHACSSTQPSVKLPRKREPGMNGALNQRFHPTTAVLRSTSMGTDTRLALRRLAATPLFTAFAILSLAAGV